MVSNSSVVLAVMVSNGFVRVFARFQDRHKGIKCSLGKKVNIDCVKTFTSI